MSYKIFINYYLNKLTFFKSLIYFYKKFFFSSENKNIINQKVKKLRKFLLKKIITIIKYYLIQYLILIRWSILSS